MTTLAKTVCEPCRGGMPPMTQEQYEGLMPQLDAQWRVVEGHHLTRDWTFPDFAAALDFVNRIGALAEAAGHHPDLYLAWGKVRVDLWTHKIEGLHIADFVLAAQIDELAS